MHAESWQMKRKWHTDGPMEQTEEQTSQQTTGQPQEQVNTRKSTGQATVQQTTGEPQEPNKRRKSTGQAGGSGNVSEAVPKKVPKPTKPKSASADAEKTKSSHAAAVSQANTTLACIGKNASWKQFKGDGGENELKQKVLELEQVIAESEFNELFLIDSKDLKKQMDASEFDVSCRRFSERIDPFVAAVLKTSKTITKQHQVRVEG